MAVGGVWRGAGTALSGPQRHRLGVLKCGVNSFTVETYPAHYQPDAMLSAHPTFALKYEGMELDFLNRFFELSGLEPDAKWTPDAYLAGAGLTDLISSNRKTSPSPGV